MSNGDLCYKLKTKIRSRRVRSQVASLTLRARDPASPSSPFTSFKLGYGSGFRISTWHKAVYAARYSTKIKTPIKGVQIFTESTRFELAVSALTGQRVNQATPRLQATQIFTYLYYILHRTYTSTFSRASVGLQIFKFAPQDLFQF